MLLHDFYADQWPVIAASVAPATARAYLSAWNQRIAPTLGDVEVAAITPWMIETAWAQWTGTPSTKSDAIHLLSRLLRRAVRMGIIASNPVAEVELPRVTAPDPVARALTPTEVRALLSHLPPVYARPIEFLAATGLRWGEMAALAPSDVSQSGLITVRRAISIDRSGALTTTPPKNRRSRVVPVTDNILHVIGASTTFAADLGVTDRVFVGPRGGVLTGKNVSRATDFHAWRAQIKTFPHGEPPLHWHDLRHTACVNFFQAGIPAPVVQEIMGHSSLAVTQQYARATAPQLVAARDALTKRGGVEDAA